MLALGLLVMGFALGRGLEPAPAARALLSTVIAALPDSFSSAPPFAIPTRWTEPTDTAIPPVATSAPTDTAIPPTATPEPTDTAIPPTATDLPPTDTAIPPTATDLPTDTAIPPTATDLPPSATPIPQASGRACYSEARAWVTGEMNIRAHPTTNSSKVGTAQAGESFDVLESRLGDSFCWLRISRGWMAKTYLVSEVQPRQPAANVARGGAASAISALNALVVAPENRCSAYDRDDYPYPQSVELEIIQRMGGRIYGPYSGATFSDRGQTDIEHIVATSEAHDSGLCAAGAQTRKTFARDLLNLTLASPNVNRRQKSGKDFGEWRPALNQCWFADTIIKVKTRYRLTVDSREKAALEATLRNCGSVGMIFASGAGPPAASRPQPAQPASNAQPAQPASGDWQQWDTNRNGRITCAEAREHGIAPVRRGHPAYPRMDDRNNDGVVCE